MSDSEPPIEKRPRRSQRERRETTRERILEAAHKTLIERGYAGASTWAICETGDFSKGTLLHHFRKRSYLFQALIAERSRISLMSLNSALDAAVPGQYVEVFLDWLWSTLEGDFFAIGLEILTAARTDPDLQSTVRMGADALTSLLDQFIDTAVEEAPAANKARLRDALRASIHLVRGIGLDLVVGGEIGVHKERFDRWRALVLELK